MKNHCILLVLAFLAILAGPAAAEDVRFTVQFSPSRISWNPQYAYTTTEAQIFTALYEGLVSYHPATLRPVPAAAEEWDISEDGLRITFRLREDLTWSNGEDIVAADFRDSWLDLLAPSTGAEYASLLDDIVGAREYRTGEGTREDVGVSAVDRRTLAVSLKRPSPQFLSILCHYSFVPVHRDFRGVRDWSALRSVPVNGPYTIRARSAEELLLERNPRYWDQASVSIDTLRILFLEDSDEVMDRFNRFDIDWVVSGMDTSRLAISEALEITPLFSTTYYYFSNSKEAWADGRVRRALALLVPWEEIRQDRLIPGTSLVPPIPNYPAADAGFPAPDERRDEALGLLDEAGYPLGAGLPGLVIRVPQEDPVADAMKSAWENTLGLISEIEIVEFPDYYDSVKSGGYDIATLTWTGDYADPHTFLGMWDSSSSFNEAGFIDPDFDRILHEAAMLPHLRRLTKLREAEDILLRTAQVMPVEHFPAINIIDRRFIEGWFPNALDIHPFKTIVPRLGFDIPGVVMR